MAPVVHVPLVASDRCIISLYENVLDPDEADSYLKILVEKLPWVTETDNWGPQSRPTCYFGDNDCIFSYVGLCLEPKPWTSELLSLRQKVAEAYNRHNSHSEADSNGATDTNATTIKEESLLAACLVNLYLKSSDHHIPWHYDEVRAHGDRKIVASLSLGGPRRFCIRRRGKDEMLFDRVLPSGSVLWMEGKTQEQYEHCLPKQEDGELRVSLTFRSIVAGYEKDREIAVDVCCT